jgi:hypothetical protein
MNRGIFLPIESPAGVEPATNDFITSLLYRTELRARTGRALPRLRWQRGRGFRDHGKRWRIPPESNRPSRGHHARVFTYEEIQNVHCGNCPLTRASTSQPRVAIR